MFGLFGVVVVFICCVWFLYLMLELVFWVGTLGFLDCWGWLVCSRLLCFYYCAEFLCCSSCLLIVLYTMPLRVLFVSFVCVYCYCVTG